MIEEKFLDELADLMEKYDVALCSKRLSDYCSSVYFIFGQHTINQCIVNTNRHHSTPYEIRCIKQRVVQEEKK